MQIVVVFSINAMTTKASAMTLLHMYIFTGNTLLTALLLGADFFTLTHLFSYFPLQPFL